MILTPSNYNILTTLVKKDWQKGIDEAKPVFKGIYESVASSTYTNLYAWLEHMIGMRKTSEGESRIFRNASIKSFTVANDEYESTLSIPLAAIEDDQYGMFVNMAKQFSASAMTLPDQLIANLFNNAFSTSTSPVLAYDGLSWCNASHTVGLSTVNNYSTAVLTTASYATAYQALINYKVQPDKDSEARPLNPNLGKALLVVPPALLFTAKTIVESAQLGSTTSATTSPFLITNPYYNTADILCTSWLSSSTAWFLLNVNSPLKPLVLQERVKLQFLEKTPVTSDRAFILRSLDYGQRWRGNSAVTFPWLAYGSTGTTS